ncbi:hypothetical protein BX600DRAFT_55647 [Xylariales sp. PMI_506]|nr:hypothetical protein BX600DRAFT_55647 [Xylariales sp. PMI_506]
MKQNGPDAGFCSDVYYSAWAFFKKRELQGIKLPAAKKPKKEAAAVAANALDVSGITLDGEEDSEVPVYDTCDDVRKKLRALLRKDGVTQAALLREISKSFSGGQKKIQSKQLTDFLGKKGATSGNKSGAFYGSYVLLEKLRIKNKQPKSSKREDMEDIHGPRGFDTKTVMSNCSFVTSSAAKYIYEDEYGRARVRF